MAKCCVTGDFESGIRWELSASGNEAKLYLSFFDGNSSALVPGELLGAGESYMGTRTYLNSEDLEFGVERFARITGLPVEFLKLLRRGIVSVDSRLPF
jgi:hypothetical protein